ncbi:hypothetical protein [Prosthecobacter sp.]|jgi:hypothetical protein|uniref:hypothetical protein n=1 Tax=Prosthecobacter sp. TaxID=1965333 RepID=UPI0037844F65
MNLLLELLPSFAAAAAILVLIVVAAVHFVRWLERSRIVAVKGSESAGSKLFHDDEWDLVVDGREVASLIPTGPPEDLNTSFITFDLKVVSGHEAEVEDLLHHHNKRAPEDERVCFRSRTREEVMMKDSQVLGTLREGGKQFTMKAYPAEAPSKQIRDHPCPPHNPETPAPPAA